MSTTGEETKTTTRRPVHAVRPQRLEDRPESEKYTRLSINLSLETAEVLKDLARRKGLSITDAVRRAIAVWKFVEDELNRGNRLAVIEKTDGKDRVREVVLLS